MVDEVKEPSAPEPAQIPKIQKDRQKLTISILTVLLVLALASAGWLYWQFSQKKDQLEKKGSEVTSLEKKIAESGDKADEKTKTSGTSSTDDLPIIIFSPGGSFTDAEKTELTNKLLDPYKAWHTDQGNLVVSIHVQQNSSVSASQYSVDAIYRNSVYEGFLFGAIDAASQDWWFPECLDACPFSASFRTTYPEVVAATER